MMNPLRFLLRASQRRMFHGSVLPRRSFSVNFSSSMHKPRINDNSKESLVQSSCQPHSLSLNRISIGTIYGSSNDLTNKSIRDPLTNAFIRNIIAPSLESKRILVYEDDPRKIVKSILDPSVIGKIIVDLPFPSRPLKKEAHRMIRIRKRKMRKHKRRKFAKKYKFDIARRKMQKELRKEQVFRMELLTQIEDAEAYDPKQYVQDIIHKLRYYPKPPTLEERKEKYRLLEKKHRSNVYVVPPRFDD